MDRLPANKAAPDLSTGEVGRRALVANLHIARERHGVSKEAVTSSSPCDL